MKNRFFIFILGFMFLFNLKVYASSGPEIEAKVIGTIDKGQTIQILINVKDIQSFFAGAMEFKYDKNVLKIKSIEDGDLISKTDINKFEAIKKIDEQNGIAAYGFSCIGKINGYSGTGTFIKINAEVLKKDSFHIKSKPFLGQPNDDYNLKLQICDSNIKELEYNFKPYDFNLNAASGSNSGTNSTAGSSINNSGSSNQNNSKESSSGTENTNASTSIGAIQDNSKKTDETNSKAVDSNNKPDNTKKETLASGITKASDKNNEIKNKSKVGIIASIVLILSIASIIGFYVYRRKRTR